MIETKIIELLIVNLQKCKMLKFCNLLKCLMIYYEFFLQLLELPINLIKIMNVLFFEFLLLNISVHHFHVQFSFQLILRPILISL